MAKKRAPDNVEICCVGRCKNPSSLIYYRQYGICDNHWEKYCDNKFDLRKYLGLGPVKKPKGYEDVSNKICDKILAFKYDIEIDITHNLPILVYEEYELWDNVVKSAVASDNHKQLLDYCVQWNGVKEDPLDLFIMIDDVQVTLLRGTGNGVRFMSQSNIEKAISILQDILNESTNVAGLDNMIRKKFNKSKVWNAVECEDVLGGLMNE